MKNIKRLIAFAMLAGSIAMMTSCTMKLDSNQRAHYDAFIKTLEAEAVLDEVPVSFVKITLSNANKGAKALKYKIVDKNENRPIPHGTSNDKLRKRFVPKKA